MRAYTVEELKNECDELIKKGKGDYQILISDDDEGNGYHNLFHLFTEDKEMEDLLDSVSLEITDSKTVILG